MVITDYWLILDRILHMYFLPMIICVKLNLAGVAARDSVQIRLSSSVLCL